MKTSVADKLNGTEHGIKVDNFNSIAFAYGFDGRVEFFHKFRIRRALVYTSKMAEHIDFRIGITFCHFIKHYNRCFHCGFRLCVTVLKNQLVIVNILCGAKGGFSVTEIVESFLDYDDIRLFPGVFAGVVMELNATVNICANRSCSFKKNRTTAPGVVDEKPEPKVICKLHPPCIVKSNIFYCVVRIIFCVIADSGVCCIRRGAVRSSRIGGNTCAKD